MGTTLQWSETVTYETNRSITDHDIASWAATHHIGRLLADSHTSTPTTQQLLEALDANDHLRQHLLHNFLLDPQNRDHLITHSRVIRRTPSTDLVSPAHS